MNALKQRKRADLRSPVLDIIINDAPASRKDRHQDLEHLSRLRSPSHIADGQFVLFDIGVAGTTILVLPDLQVTHVALAEEAPATEAALSIDEIIEKNRGLVRSCMKSVGGVSPMDRDDIEQAGLIALWKAATKFDPSRGVPFSSYAAVAIKRAMFRAAKSVKNKLNPESWDEMSETCPNFESMLVTEVDQNVASIGSHPVLRTLYEKAGALRTAKERKGVRAYALFQQGYSATQIAKMLGFGAMSTTAMVSVGKKVIQSNPVFQRIASELMDEPRKDSITVDLLGTPFELRYARELMYDLPVKFNDNFMDSFEKLITSEHVADYIVNDVRIGDQVCIIHSHTGCTAMITVKESVLEVSFVLQTSQNQPITA